MKRNMALNDSSFLEEAGKLIIVIIAPFALIWHFIDKYFKDKREDREEFIKTVVKEVMETAIKPVQDQCKQLSDQHNESIRYIHERINDLNKK